MTAERRRTELKLTHDERLLAGIRGAVEHVASRHGLIEEERTDLVAAAEQACRKCLVQLTKHDSSCTVVIDDYEDRVEVIVEGDRDANGARGAFVKHFHKNPTHS